MLSVLISTNSFHLITLIVEKNTEYIVIPCSLISARCVIYRALMIKNIEKESNKNEHSMIPHKVSWELSKIANMKTNVDKAKKAKNQTLNITAEEYTFKMLFSMHIVLSLQLSYPLYHAFVKNQGEALHIIKSEVAARCLVKYSACAECEILLPSVAM